jgi:hypothetical protein
MYTAQKSSEVWCSSKSVHASTYTLRVDIAEFRQVVAFGQRKTPPFAHSKVKSVSSQAGENLSRDRVFSMASSSVRDHILRDPSDMEEPARTRHHSYSAQRGTTPIGNRISPGRVYHRLGSLHRFAPCSPHERQ